TLVTKTALNRETDDFFSVQVTVTDGGLSDTSVVLTSTCMVEVTVLDVNDNAPVIVERSKSPITIAYAGLQVLDLN
ncbi:MAG: cadherin repeat domain-containing protein, partial [Pseudomonadota bacterium]